MTTHGTLNPRNAIGVAWLCALAGFVGCGPGAETIRIDGSSTVYPISEAVAEAYRDVDPDLRMKVGLRGTGGGMQKFTSGEIDICDASRAIKESEVAALEAAGVDFVEFSVAFDGIAIVVNPENDWIESLSVEELAAMWRPDNPAQKWSDINSAWPDEEIRLYGPGPENGTFEYFTKAIVGEERECRSDYAASENDNVLVTGVSRDKNALGYFGFAYYAENADVLKLVPVRGETGEPIAPTIETIRTGEYAPLSRPLYIYVRHDLLQRPAGADFVRFYLDEAGAKAAEVGYVPVSPDIVTANNAAYDAALASTAGAGQPTTNDAPQPN